MKPHFILIILGMLCSCGGVDNPVPEVINLIHWAGDKENLSENQVDTFFHLNTSPVIIYSQANFFYKGEAQKVQICGDFNDWSLDSAYDLTPVEYGYWHLAIPFDPKAQLEYKLVIDGKDWIQDPFNPDFSRGGFGVNSILRMPEFVKPWELDTDPKEISYRRLEFRQGSDFLDTTLNVTMLIPQRNGKDIEGVLPSVYFQDGSDYLDLGQFEKVIGNLIESGDLEPFVGVFITPYDRTVLYAGELTSEYSGFFAEELLAHIIEKFPFIDTAASRRVIVGDSYGGNISALISLKYPKVFPNCAMHSPAFLANDYEVFKIFRDSAIRDIRLSYVWGTYEFLHNDLKKFSGMAGKRGYFQTYKSYPEGHNWVFWSATYDDLLKPFLPGKSG